MSGNADLVMERNRLEAMLTIAMATLEQIANTPRNKGARMNALGTLRFLETQIKSINIECA